MEELCLETRALPMIEPLLCGIVLGLIPITLAGLFVAAWNQYRRGGALGG
jgi:cytochrome b6-f complex subunit 5